MEKVGVLEGQGQWLSGIQKQAEGLEERLPPTPEKTAQQHLDDKCKSLVLADCQLEDVQKRRHEAKARGADADTLKR